jgi:hypothetical protein
MPLWTLPPLRSDDGGKERGSVSASSLHPVPPIRVNWNPCALVETISHNIDRRWRNVMGHEG